MTGAEPPPLPDSDDPHELLGVPETADEPTLKRAYAELVKRFRPDRHPEEFQRVRRAYEQALAWLAFHVEETEAGGGEATGGGGASEERGEASSRHEIVDDIDAVDDVDARFSGDAGASPVVEDPWKDVWADVAAGRADEARLRLERRTDDAPTDAVGWALRFLVAEARGDDDPPAFLVRGLESGADLAGWVLAVLEQDALDVAERVPWETLARQRDRGEAARLFDARFVAAVTRGGLGPFLDEVRRRPFLEAAREHDGLRWVALRAAAVACFDHPDAADELYERLAREPFEDGSVEEGFLARRSRRDDWARFDVAGGRDVPALRGFLAACHALHPSDLAALGLRAAARAEPEAHLAAFDAIVDEAPGLLPIYLEGVESCLADRGDDDPPDPARQARLLAPFVEETDAVLARDWRNRFDSFALGILCIGTVGAFVALKWWGLVPAAVTIAWFAVNTGRLDRRLYRDVVRPRAREEIRRHGVTPEELVAVIKARTRLTDDIGRFDGELTEDLALHAFALAMRTDAGGSPGREAGDAPE